MSDMDKGNPLQFSPATPIPRTRNIPARIAELRSYLDPRNPAYEPVRQHVNIRAAIRLYEEGKIDGVWWVFIVDGRVVPFEDVGRSGEGFWMEGVASQRAQRVDCSVV